MKVIKKGETKCDAANDLAGRLKHLLLLTVFVFVAGCSSERNIVFIEAESFESKGGWVVDQQFMDVMGSPYLMAHGLGKPVADASTIINIPADAYSRLWVRPKNWTAP